MAIINPDDLEVAPSVMKANGTEKFSALFKIVIKIRKQTFGGSHLQQRSDRSA